MTRIYNVTYAAHLNFTPDPVDVGTKDEPNKKLKQPDVDAWRTGSRVIAIEDGWAEDAIKKLRRLLEGEDDVKEGRITEVQIVAVALVNEAE